MCLPWTWLGRVCRGQAWTWLPADPASAGPRPDSPREQPAVGWRGRRWRVWLAEVFCDGCGDVGTLGWGLTTRPGARGPRLPAGCSWVLRWHLAFGGGSWPPGSGLGGPGAQVESWWAAVQPPACAQPAVPPVCGCGRARTTLEASRGAGVGPPVPSTLHTRRPRCPGWAPCVLLSAPGLPCGGESGTGHGGRVYPGLTVGLAGARGVRTEGLCGPAVGEPLARTRTQRHVHLSSPPVSTSEMDQQVWTRPQCTVGA